MLRFSLVRLLPLVLLAVAVGCNGGSDGSKSSTKRIIFLTNVDDPFWDAARAGLEDAAKELKLNEHGLSAELDKNNAGDAKGQIDKLQQYANQTDIAAVAISVSEPNNPNIANAMRKLQEQGVKVVTVDSDIDRQSARDARFAYLGTDNILGGQELGKIAKALRPQGGKFMAFVGNKSQANAVERLTGFIQGAGEAFTPAEGEGVISDGTDHAVAEKNVRDVLDRNADVTTLVGIWAYNAHAIAQVVRDRKIRDQTTIVVFDAAEAAIRDMEAGDIDAMVVQNPYQMGYLSTKLLAALVRDDQETVQEILPEWQPDAKKFASTDGDLAGTGLKVVTPDDDTTLTQELFSEQTEVLTLSQFKDWLAKYKLKSS